jgi:opacity protein-like surface antigen
MVKSMLTNRTKFLVSSLAFLAIMDTSIVFADDMAKGDQSGFLIGLDAGRAQAHKYCHDLTNCEDKDTSIRADIGYQFNQYWSAELGYTSFGTLLKSHDNNVNASQKADAWTLSAVGTFPIGDRFGIFGRVGAARYETNNSGTVQGVRVKDEQQVKPYFGAGAKFDVTDHFLIRAEYQLYTDISGVDGAKDDVQGLYAGATFRF